MPSRDGAGAESLPAKKKLSLGPALPAVLSVAAFLGLWQIAASRLAISIILPSPLAVLRSFLSLLSERGFYQAAASTSLRVLWAFLLSLLLGLSAGIAAGSIPALRAAFAPFMSMIRSIPVLAIIVLLMIWFREGTVPVVSAFLMAFPLMEAATASGIQAIDPDLSELARVYRLGPSLRLRRIIIPSVLPFVLSGAGQSLSVIWKVVVAGEILSQPRFAIGTGLHEAKIYLETPRALAWTLAILLLCALTEYLFRLLTGRLRPAR